jgi:hemoglobin-like flavoprotein
MLTPEQITLVKESWEKVLPISETAAELFYGKLFELDPELKSLFKGDMTEQGRKLMAMINTAINGLTNLEAIVPAVQQLGERHVDYGVKAEDYDTVGAALIWTLEQGLGEAFTPDVQEAWVGVYTLVATTMKEAAQKYQAA